MERFAYFADLRGRVYQSVDFDSTLFFQNIGGFLFTAEIDKNGCISVTLSENNTADTDLLNTDLMCDKIKDSILSSTEILVTAEDKAVLLVKEKSKDEFDVQETSDVIEKQKLNSDIMASLNLKGMKYKDERSEDEADKEDEEDLYIQPLKKMTAYIDNQLKFLSSKEVTDYEDGMLEVVNSMKSKFKITEKTDSEQMMARVVPYVKSEEKLYLSYLGSYDEKSEEYQFYSGKHKIFSNISKILSIENYETEGEKEAESYDIHDIDYTTSGDTAELYDIVKDKCSDEIFTEYLEKHYNPETTKLSNHDLIANLDIFNRILSMKSLKIKFDISMKADKKSKNNTINLGAKEWKDYSAAEAVGRWVSKIICSGLVSEVGNKSERFIANDLALKLHNLSAEEAIRTRTDLFIHKTWFNSTDNSDIFLTSEIIKDFDIPVTVKDGEYFKPEKTWNNRMVYSMEDSKISYLTGETNIALISTETVMTLNPELPLVLTSDISTAYDDKPIYRIDVIGGLKTIKSNLIMIN